jgi:hypothetical protein
MAWACGSSLPGIAVSNPAGGMVVCVWCFPVKTSEKARTVKKKKKRTEIIQEKTR